MVSIDGATDAIAGGACGPNAFSSIAAIKQNPCPMIRPRFGIAAVGRCGSDWIPNVAPWKVILGVSQVISGGRYDDGPPPWGIMGV